MSDDSKYPTITVVFSEGPIRPPDGGARTLSIRAIYFTETDYQAVCDFLRKQREIASLAHMKAHE